MDDQTKQGEAQRAWIKSSSQMNRSKLPDFADRLSTANEARKAQSERAKALPNTLNKPRDGRSGKRSSRRATPRLTSAKRLRLRGKNARRQTGPQRKRRKPPLGIPPGAAMPSSRAATLIPSPKISPSSTRSPEGFNRRSRAFVSETLPRAGRFQR